MVAYSFKPYFAPQIVSGMKNHTVRRERHGRTRHSRPGEPMQLYQDMRTRNCVKILERDPICSCVLGIVIELSTLLSVHIAGIEIDGRPLHRDEIEEFARKDGFAPEMINHSGGMRGATARANMGAFWRDSHPTVSRFEGVLLHWERCR